MLTRLFQLVVLILATNVILNTNEFDLEEYNKEKQSILNVIINSAEFDSVYKSNQVYFEANELLMENTQLVLTKGNCKVKIKTEEELIKMNKQYLVLGDFTMARTNPTHARVQMESFPKYNLLNLSLVKKDSLWVIVNHHIIRE